MIYQICETVNINRRADMHLYIHKPLLVSLLVFFTCLLTLMVQVLPIVGLLGHFDLGAINKHYSRALGPLCLAISISKDYLDP